MKKSTTYFILSFIMILLSTPLGYAMPSIVYPNRNLSSEYVYILNGFIHSFMLIGILVFIAGVISVLINKNNK